MYGNETARKDKIVELALQDAETSDEAKAWLKGLKG